ncbi:uncharacterized protein K460DRAFT_188676 [Cucurbitaria berberidis CBS 394.84]|uniref:Extracellular membrane protein CFEM domain-containing protein n=1 Tax=Cucurbitaria berberidis CBS 394.84 TaxID=1168544 RepID=A0A9P4L5F4_9PLEO|nr:uncharacterized protein K460DRAFT_188676 [Cucurbitaria berberidis CBS 394.84]KAF1842585.1 hypothetical protein K460DRAFT_188676 [Cucurbitaria berberidis CBS 394.84]
MQIRYHWTRHSLLPLGYSSTSVSYHLPSVVSTQAPSFSMPSTITTILTSAVTLTSFVTVTAGQYVPEPYTSPEPYYPSPTPEEYYPEPYSTPSPVVVYTPVPYSSAPAAYSAWTPPAPYTPEPYPTAPPAHTSEWYPTSSSGSYLPPDIIGPIEHLSQCAQTVVFECLSTSQCEPHDFACVCEELKKLDLHAKVAAACSAAECLEYDAFQDEVCGYKPAPPASSSSSWAYTPKPYSANATSSAPPAPVVNTTIVYPTATVTTTQTIQIVTTNSAGQPTTIQSVVPPPPAVAKTTAPVAPPSAYTGAAVAVDAKNVMMAGAMGLMGLIFAEL